MNEAQIREEILTEFGAPTVRVELDETAWPNIIKRAKRWFHSKRGVMAFANMSMQSTPVVPTDCEAVTDVILAADCGNTLGAILTGGFFADIVPADVIARGGMFSTSFANYSAYVQLVQQIETVRRVFSSEPDWYVDAAGVLHIMPNNVTGPAIIFYKKKIENWEVDILRDRDIELFYRACRMEAKATLGRIRTKYPSYPAAGGNIESDGATLLEEAKEEREKLNEDIELMSMPIPVVKG